MGKICLTKVYQTLHASRCNIFTLSTHHKVDGYADHGGASMTGCRPLIAVYFAGPDKKNRGSHRNMYAEPASAAIKCDRM